MAAFGFDFDQTLTADPHVFKLLMHSLISTKHEVYIITAVRQPNTNELQQQKIDSYKFRKGTHYHHVYFVDEGTGSPEEKIKAGRAKRDLCRRLGVVLFIDDKPEFVQATSEVCRSLLVVK